MTRRKYDSPPFIWLESTPKKLLVLRMVIGNSTGYRLYCETTTKERAQHLVDLLTGDGPELEAT